MELVADQNALDRIGNVILLLKLLYKSTVYLLHDMPIYFAAIQCSYYTTHERLLDLGNPRESCHETFSAACWRRVGAFGWERPPDGQLQMQLRLPL